MKYAHVHLKNAQRGISVIELIIVMTFFGLLIGFAVVNLFHAQHQSSLGTSLDTLVANLRDQQFRAMNGDTEGRVSSDNYGIHFTAASNQYVLFHGIAYNAGDSANFSTTMSDTVQVLSTTFPSGNIIFTKGIGDVSDFVNGQNTVTVKDTVTNQTKTVTVNRHGVVTAIN